MSSIVGDGDGLSIGRKFCVASCFTGWTDYIFKDRTSSICIVPLQREDQGFYTKAGSFASKLFQTLMKHVYVYLPSCMEKRISTFTKTLG